jgi:hypothetical protein
MAACLGGSGHRLVTLDVDRIEAVLGDAKRHRCTVVIAAPDRERQRDQIRTSPVPVGTICGFDYGVASPGSPTMNTEPLPGSLVGLSRACLSVEHRRRRDRMTEALCCTA